MFLKLFPSARKMQCTLSLLSFSSTGSILNVLLIETHPTNARWPCFLWLKKKTHLSFLSKSPYTHSLHYLHYNTTTHSKAVLCTFIIHPIYHPSVHFLHVTIYMYYDIYLFNLFLVVIGRITCSRHGMVLVHSVFFTTKCIRMMHISIFGDVMSYAYTYTHAFTYWSELLLDIKPADK